MHCKYCKFIAIGIAGSLCMWGVLSVAMKERPEPDPSMRFVKGPNSLQTRNDADILNGIVDSDGWNEGKNHTRIKSAVAPALSDVSKATVRIFSRNESLAMGTIVTANGYIVSKGSEIEKHKKLICRCYDGQQFRARIVGIVDRHDLALIKIDAKNLSYVDFDTAINPGIGAIVATPSLSTRPVAIGVVSSRQQRIESDGVLGIRMDQDNGRTIVLEVLVASAAETAGIQVGDVVTAVDGKAVRSMMSIVNIIGKHLPGDEIEFEVLRNNKPHTFLPKLGRLVDLDEENSDFQSYLGGDLSGRRSGFPSIIQHDTFLLPEHCGSPIVDLDGRVVGINIARAERIASYALPNSIVAASIDKLIREEGRSAVVAK